MEKIRKFLRLFQTHICTICGSLIIPDGFSAELCPSCIDELKRTVPGKKENTETGAVIFAGEYAGIIKKLIAAYKFKGRKKLADSIASFLIIPLIPPIENIVFTYVPASKKGMRQRGFDQGEILCKYLVRHLICANRCAKYVSLFQREAGKQQKILNKKERIAHIHEKIFLKKTLSIDCNAPIFVIDDVYTTGATVTYCQKLLQDAGLKNVYGIVAAYHR